MNLKYLLFFLGASTLFSCNDDFGKIGTSVQPDADKLTLFSDTVYFQTAPTTFEVDSFYAVSSNALLGNFSDPNGLYGNLECDFMTQFKATSLRLTDVYQDKLDSITLNLAYSSHIGDSLTIMQATVYELTNQLKKEAYANSKVSDYCDKSILLGRKAYSAYDVSGKNPKNTVQIKLSDEFTNRIYTAYKANNNIFDIDDNSKFLNIMKGVYVTNTFGNGSILSIYGGNIRLTFHYQNPPTVEKGYKGNDSIVYKRKTASFAATSEVLLTNRYQNSRMERLLAPESNISYIKSPAGVFTKLDFPLTAINNKVGKGTLNGARLKISSFRTSSNSTTLQAPDNLMLIKKNAIKSFFSSKTINLSDSLSNNCIAIATRNKADGTYTFSNISGLLNNLLPNQKNGGVLQSNVQFALIPVSVESNSGNITSIRHYNLPSGLKFSTAKDKFNLTIFYAK